MGAVIERTRIWTYWRKGMVVIWRGVIIASQMEGIVMVKIGSSPYPHGDVVEWSD